LTLKTFIAIAKFAASCVLIFVISWKLSLVLFASVPFLGLIAVIYGSFAQKYARIYLEKLADISFRLLLFFNFLILFKSVTFAKYLNLLMKVSLGHELCFFACNRHAKFFVTRKRMIRWLRLLVDLHLFPPLALRDARCWLRALRLLCFGLSLLLLYLCC
jgi:ABC-type multidrug transport system fused ATPase/permease subunit